MEQVLVVGRQVLLIFMYVAIGVVCVRVKIFTEAAGRSLSSFALSVIMPLLMIQGFLRPVDLSELKAVGLAFFLAIVFHILGTVLALVAVPKREDPDHRIERLAVLNSNCGYMAIPLIRAAIGEAGVFYALAYISVFNIFLWSVGIMILSGSRKISLKKIILNPGIIGFAAGAAIYLAHIPVPALIREAIGGIVAMNTPLPMITTGIFLAGIDVKKALADARLYYISFMRLIAAPIIMLLIIKLLGVAEWMPGSRDVVLTICLSCACPCAAAVVLLPAGYGLKGDYGAKLLAISTLFSVITLPAITLLIQFLL